MAVHINEECIGCNLCVPVCPNRAIAELLHGDERITHGVNWVVDPDLCTECHGFYDTPQCVGVCPTDAIPIGELVKETDEQLFAKADALKAYRASLGLPVNIAYAEPDNADMTVEKGFGPKPS